MCPRVPGPTGTVIGLPLLTTDVPRTTPSVGCMHTARTRRSPRCWATSAVMVRLSPCSSRSKVSALLMSGRFPGGNSTSTTGPMTRMMRPSADAVAMFGSFGVRDAGRGDRRCSWCGLGWMVDVRARSVAERLGAPDDLGDLGGDLLLTGLVHDPRQVGRDLLGVVGGGLHRSLPAGVLRGGGLQQAVVDLGLHVARDQGVEQDRLLGLEDELRVEVGAAALELRGLDREQLHADRGLGQRAAEGGVDQ